MAIAQLLDRSRQECLVACVPTARGVERGPRPAFTAALGLALALGAAVPASAASAVARANQSVIKIYSTVQRPDYTMPWQVLDPAQGSGSGFLIRRRWILTNAHVVSDARFLEVQREGDPRKYPARVAFIGHDCDLAVLVVDDDAFYIGTRPLSIGATLPQLADQVTVLGYPLGGNRLSITRGVVSRIDYSAYSHSGVDAHLALQVDAAINPGNSGGPVLYRDRVVGVAFQGLRAAQNIGYAIPIPVIRHFLTDVEDGTYHGYPELGVSHVDSRNPALRGALGLGGMREGVAVGYVDPFGSAAGILRPGDVLLAIDGHPIADDGSVVLDGTSVEYVELLERKQWGETVTLDVWRERARSRIPVPLTNPPDGFALRQQYDVSPRYVIVGGLVFSPLTRDYMQTVGAALQHPDGHELVYAAQFGKPDRLYEGRDEFVVLIRRLPHPVNTYCDGFERGLVSTVNGRRVRGLTDLADALKHPQRGFHTIEFEGRPDFAVLDAAAAASTEPAILSTYRIAAPARLEAAP